MSTVKFEIPKAAIDALDQKLKGMGGIAQSQILLKGMVAAGRAVRTRGMELAPVRKDEMESAFAMGMLSDSTISLHRRSTRGKQAALKTPAAWKIKAFVRDMEPILEVRVKAARRAPHFHLVELGHEVHAPRVLFSSNGKLATRKGMSTRKTGQRTKPSMFLSRGGKYSTTQQIAEMQKAVKSALRKLTGA